MADLNFTQPLKLFGPWAQVHTCQFTTAGTGAITGFVGRGVVSVTRTDVGLFEVLLPVGWKDVTPIFAVGGAAAAQVGRPTMRSATASTRKLVVATVESDAAPVDIETTGVTIYCTFIVGQG